jgi:hypothetical protein
VPRVVAKLASNIPLGVADTRGLVCAPCGGQRPGQIQPRQRQSEAGLQELITVIGPAGDASLVLGDGGHYRFASLTPVVAVLRREPQCVFSRRSCWCLGVTSHLVSLA